MPNDGIPTDEELNELISGADRRTGAVGNLVAHGFSLKPRKAVSVFLFDGDGRMLLQRRAACKYYSPGVWSSSCDGHVRPGEAPEAAATARLAEELDVIPEHLTNVGASIYRLRDPAFGLVECVINHVFVGRLLTSPHPDPDEVAEVALATPAELGRMLADDRFSSWFRAVTEVALIRIPHWLPGLADWREDAIRDTGIGGQP